MPRAMMWMNYRRGNGLAVPAPFDDMSSDTWWYDRIGQLAQDLSERSITDVLFPSPCKTQSGAYRTGEGYGLFDHYDLGDKDQRGSVATRFGTADQLRRAIAICRANAINVHLDIVMHQCAGGRGGVYRYKSATGATDGLFPKDPGFFRGDPAKGFVPEDPVVSPPDDFSFGDELSPVDAQPPHQLWTELLHWGDWLFRTTGAQGGRIDDTKGEALSFMNSWLSYGAMASKFFFCEHASGNSNDLAWYRSQIQRAVSMIDFDFHYNMAMPLTRNGDRVSEPADWLAGRGFIGRDPMHAVPFVESMDSDTNGFATIVWNKLLAYALMLAGEGLPLIYVRDYLRQPDCYGLQPRIDNLLWCHARLANGPTVKRYGDQHVLVLERTGSPGMIATLNNDTFDPDWKTVNVQSAFGAGQLLHDYSGGDETNRWTDGQGRVTLGIPPGADGRGYGMWAPAGHGGALAPRPGWWCEQVFYGGQGRAIAPASAVEKRVCRVWCAPDTDLTARLDIDTPAALSITSPSGVKRDLPFDRDSIIAIDERGWHEIAIQTRPGAPPTDFRMPVRYRATQDLRPGE
jgi:alpha-amylase